MNCEEAIRFLPAWIDNELDVAHADALERHLAQCARCRAAATRQRHVRELTQAAMHADPPPQLTAEIRAALGNTSVNRSHRFARAAAVALLMLVSWLSGIYWPHGGDKFVYHIDDAAVATKALRNIEFHLAATPRAKIVVVTHNEGVDFLLRGATDAQGHAYADTVAKLAARGVQFRVCNNTLNVRHIPPTAVIAQASLVPSGIAEVGRLERQEGYTYLKP